MSKQEKPSNLIRGPWSPKPKVVEGSLPYDAIPDNVKKITVDTSPKLEPEDSDDGLEDFSVDKDFGEICITAMNSRPLESRIEEEKAKYKNWKIDDLVAFARNTRNHPIFKQKPALTIAIFRLMKEKLEEVF